MNCPKCGAENPNQNRFCDTCGTKLVKKEKKTENQPQVSSPTAAHPASPVAEKVRVGAPGLKWLTGEQLVWLVILAVAAFLRFYALGEKPLHHDESLHAFYSWELFKGMGYAYNPMMHGPLLFHFNALAYFLFGASDYTCRIVPAVLAMLTVVMAWFLRPYLGRVGAIFTGIMITISPSFTYFGRFIRNDIHIAAFTMVMVYALFRYIDTRRPNYLYLGAAALSMSFCTKEVTYITGAIFVSFLFFRWLWEYTSGPAGENQLIMALRNVWAKKIPPGMEESPWRRSLGQVLDFMFRPLGVATLVFFGIIMILYTTVFTNPQGFLHAFTKSISYWLGQHEVQRGSQPVYFYAGLIPLYETLALIGTLAALVYYSFIKPKTNRVWRLLAYLILGAAWWLFAAHGNETFGLIFSLLLISLGTGLLAYFSFEEKNNFVTFLIVWALASFSDYSFAGERMPWLILHPLLPMILLTGTWLGEFWERFRPQRVWLLTGFVLLGTMMLHNTSLLNFYEAGANPRELLVYVQSSTDVPQVVRQINNMSKRLTGGLDMKITCEDYCSWPFAWYLRDFKHVGYPKYTATQSEGSIEKNPLIISGVEAAAPGHDDRVAELLAEEYTAQRYKLRVWWSPDSNLFLNDTWAGKCKKAWKLFMYREPWSGLGSYDMIVYIRKDLEYLYWGHAE